MILEMDISLPLTLGCGQAHRWRPCGEDWEGVLDGRLITLRPREGGVEVSGGISRERIESYLRIEDDLPAIHASIGVDPLMRSLSARYPDLRLLRQDPWECLASYVLAVNANLSRIANMIEAVCVRFGRDLGGRHTFPDAAEIWERGEELEDLRLGYRSGRLRELSGLVARGELDPDSLRGMDYEPLIEKLKTLPGVGPKVADCVALFSMDRMEAFPVDARIKRALAEHYGIEGSYRHCSRFGMERFGAWAGYAQELLYTSAGSSSWAGQTQAGGRCPV